MVFPSVYGTCVQSALFYRPDNGTSNEPIALMVKSPRDWQVGSPKRRTSGVSCIVHT